MSHIGCHISIAKFTLKDTYNYVRHELHASAFQTFITTNRSGSVKPCHDMKGIKTFLKKLESRGVKMFIHGKYMYNFCHEKEWQLIALIEEMKLANKFKADLVIHQGHNVSELKLTREEALVTYAGNITLALKKTPKLENSLLLENSARQGTELGYSLGELTHIRDLIPKKYRSRVGFCFDTCHIFVAGEYEMKTPDDVSNMFKDIANTIGIENLKLIHMNDSKVRFDGHSDRHEDLEKGYIWKDNIDSLEMLVKLSCKYGIPMVTETPCGREGKVKEIKLLKNLL